MPALLSLTITLSVTDRQTLLMVKGVSDTSVKVQPEQSNWATEQIVVKMTVTLNQSRTRRSCPT